MKKKKSLKKTLLSLVIILILALVFLVHPFYAETVPAELSITQHLKNAPKLIAHRGFSGAQGTELRFDHRLPSRGHRVRCAL